MRMISVTRCAFLATLLVFTGCGQGTEEAAPEPDSDVAEPAGRAAADPALPARTPAPEGARVFFITPGDGEAVGSPVRVEFGVEGMNVVPAGQEAENSGHHHILIDTDLPVLDLPVPADARHVHFGDGSSSTEISLEPGQHTLQLLFADHLHIPHDPPVYSEPITITVE